MEEDPRKVSFPHLFVFPLGDHGKRRKREKNHGAGMELGTDTAQERWKEGEKPFQLLLPQPSFLWNILESPPVCPVLERLQLLLPSLASINLNPGIPGAVLARSQNIWGKGTHRGACNPRFPSSFAFSGILVGKRTSVSSGFWIEWFHGRYVTFGIRAGCSWCQKWEKFVFFPLFFFCQNLSNPRIFNRRKNILRETENFCI